MQVDSEQPSERAWRDVYLAAVFESDLSKSPERIAIAEYAILRDRELWYSGGSPDREKHALVGAMCALEALGNIHQCPRPVPPTGSHRAEAASGLLGEVGKGVGSTEASVGAGRRLITGGLFCKITDSEK